MSLKVTIGGSVEVAKECVQKVKFRVDIPLDSNARTKDVGATIEITGKILTAADGDPFDTTREMALWSMVPAEDASAYREVVIEVVSAGIVERKYTFPRAFVVDYKESYENVDGIGQFRLTIKEKKDKLDMLSVEGGYLGA